MTPTALRDAIAGELALVRALAPSVKIGPDDLLWRDADLCEPGTLSPNRQCRVVEAADGWLAINLARDDDRDLLPAWLGVEAGETDWDAIALPVRRKPVAALVEGASLLSLPVAAVGEATASPPHATTAPSSATATRSSTVLDLSALWAGPLCAGLLADAGLAVIRVESVTRPDPTPLTSPLLDARINGGKRRRALRLDDPALLDLIDGARVLVTSGRPHALARLGLTPERLFARNPALSWIAITAHGFHGAAAMRVGFGDDCAAAGGLVAWEGGSPRFLGDALADPLTGLRGARLALEHLAADRSGLIDVPLAATAADFAARSVLR
ncbi:MAG: CoA transferase [Novosphingobium sp.]|nr:CoA transferase [Novosphingobium sp.]